MIRSLRLRLLIGTSISISVVLILLGLAIYFSVQQSLQSEFDADLMNQARTLAATAERHGDRVQLEFDPQQMPEFLAREHPEYFQAWLDDGRPITRSGSLGSDNLPNPGLVSTATVTDVRLPNGRSGRALTLPITPHEDQDQPEQIAAGPVHRAFVTVARETAVLRHTLGRLRILLIVLFASAILVSGAVLNTVALRAIKPVKHLARDIEQLQESNLSQRFSSGEVPTELAAIPEKLNGLLERLETAFARERAFTADVAHELRTPLAGIQTTLEVCRSRQRSSLEYQTAIDDTHRIANQMQGMVENLLLLARADAGQLPLKCASFDLCELVEECLIVLQSRTDDRRLTVHRCMSKDHRITTDCDKLRIIMQNLLENAVSYANDAGAIRISCKEEGGSTVLEITNTGSEIAASEIPQLCRRFWRGDAARSHVGFHHGLGLSLCDRLINILRGQMIIESSLGGEFKVRLRLP